MSAELDALAEAIARRAAEIVLAELRQEPPAAPSSLSPYLTIKEAAEFLRCPRQRVDDLLSQRRLKRHKDGSRTLVSRAELEAYVTGRRVAPSVAPRPRSRSQSQVAAHHTTQS